MIRLLIAAPLALFLSLLLFYGLALITSMNERQDNAVSLNPVLDFLMVRQESALEVRQRQLPPEIEPPQQPEIPELEAQNINVNVDVSLPTIHVPDISAAMDVSLSPSLHNLSPVAAPAPTPVMGIDTNPVVLTRIPPRYPRRALRRRQEGYVVIEFVITDQGTVKRDSVVVVESKPRGVFDKEVLRAIKRWHFKTRVVNGRAIAFKARQKLEFKLEQ